MERPRDRENLEAKWPKDRHRDRETDTEEQRDRQREDMHFNLIHSPLKLIVKVNHFWQFIS